MKRLALGSPTGSDINSQMKWATDALRQIEQASAEDIEAVLGEFSTTGAFTETRSFDASSATLDDLRNVLATMLSDIKKRGQKRDYAS